MQRKTLELTKDWYVNMYRSGPYEATNEIKEILDIVKTDPDRVSKFVNNPNVTDFCLGIFMCLDRHREDHDFMEYGIQVILAIIPWYPYINATNDLINRMISMTLEHAHWDLRKIKDDDMYRFLKFCCNHKNEKTRISQWRTFLWNVKKLTRLSHENSDKQSAPVDYNYMGIVRLVEEFVWDDGNAIPMMHNDLRDIMILLGKVVRTKLKKYDSSPNMADGTDYAQSLCKMCLKLFVSAGNVDFNAYYVGGTKSFEDDERVVKSDGVCSIFIEMLENREDYELVLADILMVLAIIYKRGGSLKEIDSSKEKVLGILKELYESNDKNIEYNALNVMCCIVDPNKYSEDVAWLIQVAMMIPDSAGMFIQGMSIKILDYYSDVLSKAVPSREHYKIHNIYLPSDSKDLADQDVTDRVMTVKDVDTIIGKRLEILGTSFDEFNPTTQCRETSKQLETQANHVLFKVRNVKLIPGRCELCREKTADAKSCDRKDVCETCCKILNTRFCPEFKR